MHVKRQIFRICIAGRVELDWSSYFNEIAVQYADLPSGKCQTILIGMLPDQTALHGVLAQIRDFGLSLMEVKRLDEENNLQKKGENECPPEPYAS